MSCRVTARGPGGGRAGHEIPTVATRATACGERRSSSPTPCCPALGLYSSPVRGSRGPHGRRHSAVGACESWQDGAHPPLLLAVRRGGFSPLRWPRAVSPSRRVELGASVRALALPCWHLLVGRLGHCSVWGSTRPHPLCGGDQTARGPGAPVRNHCCRCCREARQMGVLRTGGGVQCRVPCSVPGSEPGL